MKKSCLVLVSLLLAGTFYCQGNTYAYVVDDYYPTAQGSSWEYKGEYSNSEGQSLAYSNTHYVDGFEDVNYGGVIYTGFKFYDPDGTFSHCNIKRNTSGGIEQIKSFWSEGTNIGYSLYGTPESTSPSGPYLFVPSSFSVGDTHEVNYKKYSYDSAGVLKKVSTEHDVMTLEGVENVTVSAGTFEDCLKLKLVAEENATNLDIDRESYAYIAKGVGLVKGSTDVTWVDMGNVSHWEKYSNELMSASVTPEPASMLLFGLGGVAMAAIRRKRKA